MDRANPARSTDQACAALNACRTGPIRTELVRIGFWRGAAMGMVHLDGDE